MEHKYVKHKNYSNWPDDRRVVNPSKFQEGESHQDYQITGRDEASEHLDTTKPATITQQLHEMGTMDVAHMSMDQGGLSNKFGQGGPGDRRDKRNKTGAGNIMEMIHPQGNKTKKKHGRAY